MRPTRFSIRSLPCRSSLLVHPFAPARAAFSTSVACRHNTSAASTVAQNVQRTEQTTTTSSAKNSGKSFKSARTKTIEPEDTSFEEQARYLDQVHAMELKAPYDIWARPVGLFDLHIPTWRSARKDASIVGRVNAAFANIQNTLRNALSLYRMAREQSFPGVRVKRAWSIQLFKVQSTPWLKLFLGEVLETYKQVNQLVAAGEAKALKKLTISNYQEHLIKQMRKQNPSYVYVWKFHGESKPSKVVSIRAEEVNLSAAPITYGNRFLIQACVKFETMQSLEVYTKRGERIAGDGIPKPVVEYLVFQKRMWYDTPWVIREQLFEGLEGKYKAAV